MDKNEVAAILDEIGTLLELKGENPFRCNAYHNAARSLQNLDRDLAEVVAAGELDKIPGIGETMREKIVTLVETGHLPFYEKLKAETPPGLLEMLRIPGMGPKKVKALYEQLGIDTVPKLKEACERGDLAKLRGFGKKTQEKILEGIAFLDQTGHRVRLDVAMAIAEKIVSHLHGCRAIQRMEVCGSIRRRRETCKDIDILVSSKRPAEVMDRFVSLPDVVSVVAHGETKSSITVAEGTGAERVIMNADLRVVDDAQFPFALHYFTGSKEHNIAMRQRAIDYGLKLNEYGLTGKGKNIKCKEEADIFHALDLQYIPPELRENTGEIEAAAEGKLPKLIEIEDIQGVFHNHTNESDGRASLEDMAAAAKKLGFKYLGIADHSQSLTVANGLSPDRVRRQMAAIDELNRKLRGIMLFKGTEVDILPDGRLDYPDDLLAEFDYVVASVHTHFNQTEEEMTRRILRAMDNPHVTMIGHLTGRLLLKRDAYKVNQEEVLRKAAKTGTMIEINAHPQRQDLDWIHCKRAKALGVTLVINPDAHSTEGLALYRFGVYVARRGWLEKNDVFNTHNTAAVKKALAKRRTI